MIKHICNLLILLALSLITLSCNSDDNSSNVIEHNPYEKYIGKYKGNYYGGDTGTWEVAISNQGMISGTVRSSQFNLTFQLEGEIDANGNLNATYQYNNQAAGVFEAVINEDSVSGIWSNSLSNLAGTLEGNKF